MPRAIIACVGGGSNAIGAFAHYIDEPDVRLRGVEPEEAAPLTQGEAAIIHGFKSLTLIDENNEPQRTYLIAAGRDYQSIEPEHSQLKTSGRGSCVTIAGGN